VHVSADPEAVTTTFSAYVPGSIVTQSPPWRASFVAAPTVASASACDAPLLASLPEGDTKNWRTHV
jgi:hypothetical protein